MKQRIIITLLAAAGLALLDTTGALKGSVGGSFAVLLYLLAAALAVGIYDAWAMKRGVLGWIGSIVVAVVGAAIGAFSGSLMLETTITLLKWEGRPGSLFLAMMAIITLLGSWFALWLVNRFR